MDFRQLTPPFQEFEDFNDVQCSAGSATTNGSYNNQSWSPDSVRTHLTTPDRSPGKVRETGPTLLPKVRVQDQLLEPVAPNYGHVRMSSLPRSGYPVQLGSQLTAPSASTRSVSPSAYASNIYMAPTRTAQPTTQLDVPLSRTPSLSHSRSSSASNIRSHSRNSSSGSIDASLLVRYGYPTYRQSPTPQPTGPAMTMSRTPSAMNHLTPISMPGGQVQSYPQQSRNRTLSPPANPSRLSSEIQPDISPEEEQTSIMDYLSRPNPTPSLVRRTITVRNSQYFWFDVRNLCSWSDFNLKTMSSLPDLFKLLEFSKLPSRLLPTPGRVNLDPESHAHLAELCAAHHAVKVNAALKIAQGSKHMAIRALKTSKSARQQPDFVSNYQSDAEKTIYGDNRGRVVGIVRCFDEWNSGMRNESPTHKVSYLRGLAALHHHMREHGCRYGFIMTEIELVCVRAGGPPTETSNVPLFGFLELAAPVQMATSGLTRNGDVQITAGLALWYLHMLAKEQPLPGQYSWRMDVGGPTARTRAHHLPKDEWIPKPTQSEKRQSKLSRGWHWPDEPVSRQERGRGKRGRI